MDVEEFLAAAAERARRMIKGYPFLDEDLERALSSPLVRGVSMFDAALLLRFQDVLCEKCGECCRRSTPIAMCKSEAEAIARFLRMPYKKFKRRFHLTPAGDGVFHMPAAPCPFLRGSWCSVYPVRPLVCRAFPAGALMAEVIKAETGVEAPLYCSALQKFFAHKIAGLVLRFRLEREEPLLAREIEREATRLFLKLNQGEAVF